MKICPFVSHMLGDGDANPWTLDANTAVSAKFDGDKKKAEGVVILGYEDEDSQADTMTEVAVEQLAAETVPSHLYCLKESCRFYKDKTGDCQFDLTFSMLSDQKSKAPKNTDFSKQLSKDIAKDIDKIWKFQTKSVAELVKSIGEAEKNQAKSTTNLRKDVEKNLDMLAAKLDKSSATEVKKSIGTLQKKLEDREQGFEDLSSTMSELVLNLHESISSLQDKSDVAFKRMDQMADSLPKDESVNKLVKDTIEQQLKQLAVPDVKKSIRTLADRVDDIFRAQQNTVPELEQRFEVAAKAQTKMESRISAWQEEIAERIADLKTQQRIWDERFKKFDERQTEIMSYLEDVRDRRDGEQARTSQKEAKKNNNLGVASFHNGAFEMARDQFLQAVKADPEFAEAYNNLGLAYTELNAEEDATEAFSRAVELNPSLHAAYNNLGYIFFKKGEYDQAIEMYNEALGRSTDNSSAYTNLGNAYYKLGRLSEARKAWTKAIEIDPGNEKASRNLERIGEETD
ncbi:MAG: tetratricopeptide repeat protein [Candidatus Krumholzibacteria bacterium]|nr:tetratricopeptide repeat protein [Candidatus Krumholzibacteria bacterium]